MDYDPEAPTWKTWLKAAGAGDVDASRGTHFSLPDYGLQAAIEGAGVVLGWRTLSAPDVAAGRVPAPFDLNLSLRNNLYYPEAHGQRKNIVVPLDWLKREVFEAENRGSGDQ